MKHLLRGDAAPEQHTQSEVRIMQVPSERSPCLVPNERWGTAATGHKSPQSIWLFLGVPLMVSISCLTSF